MSVIYTSDIGWFISHEKFIENVYKNVLIGDKRQSYTLRQDLFKIHSPYATSSAKPKKKLNLKRKLDYIQYEQLKEVKNVESLYDALKKELLCTGLLQKTPDERIKNTEALVTAQDVYDSSGKNNIVNIVGINVENSVNTAVNNDRYLFPKNCNFYCKDVANLSDDLQDKFDLIVLDPPWWNKYIRRKKSKTNNAYNMMYNYDLGELPIANLIKDDGIIVVWCTNSPQHLESLREDLFKKWDVQYVTKWYWIKVTKSGETICKFSEPPGKQPFEQIIFGCRNTKRLQDFKEKLLLSVPSALHSHKPPLMEVLRQYLPEEPKCLEIFARYLLPNWTSYGIEAIRLQHESLYDVVQEKAKEKFHMK